MVKRTLVLGGGGSVGLAWEAAILGGLSDSGFDARAADLIIGTSAGSVVGACVAHGSDPRVVLRERAAPDAGERANFAPNPEDVAAVFRVWGGSASMTPAACAEVGRLAMASRTMPEEQWLGSFAEYGWPGWPETQLLVMAVACETGALRAFSSDDGVPIEVAAAASCAVPGLAPTVTIDGRHYMDGGVGSWTSAELALRVNAEKVLIVAPAGVAGPGVRGLAAGQVAEETAALKAAGATVRLITFDDAARDAGKNLMDAGAIPLVVAAGDAHVLRIAKDVCAWWGG
jgi:NTE family protein